MRHPPMLACLLTSTLILAALPAAAQAQGPARGSEALALRSLAATCAACHGTDGRAADGASVPGLAGQPREALETQLLAFKAGTRPSTVMQQLAKGYSDAQIRQLAAYFAAQPK